MPKAYPKEFRDDVVAVAQRREPGVTIKKIADDFGEVMTERTAWRIGSTNGWFSRFGKKPGRGKSTKAGPPVHDDLVQWDFTATAANELWLADIIEYRTLEEKLYVCANMDVFSNRIVGY